MLSLHTPSCLMALLSKRSARIGKRAVQDDVQLEGEENVEEENVEEVNVEENVEEETSAQVLGDGFEETTKQVLEGMGSFALERCGGKSDGGVDLSGTLEDVVLVLVQCKRSKHRASPRWLREFQGAVESVSHNPSLYGSSPAFLQSSTNERPALGLFVSSSGFTREAVQYLDHATCSPFAAAVVDPLSRELLHFYATRAAHQLFASAGRRLVLGFDYRRTATGISKVVSHLRLAPL